MRRIILAVLLSVVCVSAAMALSEQDLSEVTAKLVTASGRGGFSFSVDGSQELNACAYPSGKILVTRGMLLALDRQDQLAFVVGHEMTHVIEKHAISQVKRSLWGLLVGAVAGKLLGGDRDSMKTGAQVGGALFGAQRSQENEYKADTGGCKLAAKAGYDPNGAIESMQLLQRRYGNGQAGIPVLGWFASHPDTGGRVKNLQAVVAKLPGGLVVATKPQGIAGNSAPSFEGSGLSPEAQDSLRRLIERQRAKAQEDAKNPTAQAPEAVQTAPAAPQAQAEPVKVLAPVNTEPEPVQPADELWLKGKCSQALCPPVNGLLVVRVKFEFVDSTGATFASLNGKIAPFILAFDASDLVGHEGVVVRYTAFDSEGHVVASGERKVVVRP